MIFSSSLVKLGGGDGTFFCDENNNLHIFLSKTNGVIKKVVEFREGLFSLGETLGQSDASQIVMFGDVCVSRQNEKFEIL